MRTRSWRMPRMPWHRSPLGMAGDSLAVLRASWTTIMSRRLKDSAAFFGFYECVNDWLDATPVDPGAVSEWARQKGSTKGLLGPMNPTSTDECRLGW